MDAYECVATKLDVRQFESKTVPADVKLKILEAGRLTGSGMNTQHWHFILVQQQESIHRLAQDTTTGRWLDGCNFAVIVLTDAKYDFHGIDAGRTAQDMQLTGWNFGVASCIVTGLREDALREDFGLPNDLSPSILIGFGYPARRLSGKKKDRKQLHEVISLERYGSRFDPQSLK